MPFLWCGARIADFIKRTRFKGQSFVYAISECPQEQMASVVGLGQEGKKNDEVN